MKDLMTGLWWPLQHTGP